MLYQAADEWVDVASLDGELLRLHALVLVSRVEVAQAGQRDGPVFRGAVIPGTVGYLERHGVGDLLIPHRVECGISAECNALPVRIGCAPGGRGAPALEGVSLAGKGVGTERRRPVLYQVRIGPDAGKYYQDYVRPTAIDPLMQMIRQGLPVYVK